MKITLGHIYYDPTFNQILLAHSRIGKFLHLFMHNCPVTSYRAIVDHQRLGLIHLGRL